jgi:isopentenyl-diphosphate delta-isomerase
MTPLDEHVVLLDNNYQSRGTHPKSSVHHANTPLHRAFSCFLFDEYGNLLVTQRALTKKTWPGIWSNTCCGHPAEGESFEAAATRRLREELGMRAPKLHLIRPNFKYYVEREGVVENEHCPVLVGFTKEKPQPNPAEVNDYCWVPWSIYEASAREIARLLRFRAPANKHEFEAYRHLFASREAYEQHHSIKLAEGTHRVSEWSLWETIELAPSETFKDLLRIHTSYGKR